MRLVRRALGPSSDALEKPFVFTKPRKHLKPLSVSGHGASLLHDPLFNKVGKRVESNFSLFGGGFLFF